jgi:hypothetical protein
MMMTAAASPTGGSGAHTVPMLADDFIAARAAAIVAQKRARLHEPDLDRRWWQVGLGMFVLGVVNGLAWWILTMIPHFDVLPRLLP